jgi:hypothetical protein
MIVEYICPPAILYLAFSITQIIIDMFRGDTNTAFLKFIVMIIFTLALNLLCSAGLGIISWFIVFIPFILMTYITTVLAFVFGIPKKDSLRPERPERKSREDHERERNHNIVGGCAGTQYGCCYDGTTAKVDHHGSNCPHKHRHKHDPKPDPKPHHHKKNIGGCAGTQYGCCYDGTTAKVDHHGSNCPHKHRHKHDPKPDPKPHHHKKNIGGCAGEQYGCCEDGVSARPCPQGMVPMPNSSSSSSEPAPAESSSSQSSLIGACAGSEFGCCSDGKTYAIAKPCKYETSPID